MIDLFREISDYCRLFVPEEHKRPIAIVGAGGIVDGQHLVAYKLAGLEVVGITDVDLDRARDVATRHGIGRVYGSLAELLADDRVEVVDIAVPVEQQAAIFRAAVAAGKHILAQKPFTVDPETARELASLAASAGVVAAVNQQLRFDEGIAAAHRMVELGWLGTLTSFTLSVNVFTDWKQWEWAKEMQRLEVMVHSIHYHDVVRWFLGEPSSVHADGGRVPGQFPIGETRTTSSYRFAGGASALVFANHMNPGGDDTAEFRIEGTGGAIRGTLGLMYDYPTGRPDTLEVTSSVVGTDGWMPYPVTQRWFPHAFIGTMGSVLEAIATGSPPRTAVSDNVKTVELVAALYRSMESEEVVRL
ncbi:gfo/Idh/MocA family oxidoreductase [Nakamurella antarctica]|uniref:Gfo/Idh/MocA family oxidoreductase n=1 Tax=Nakamurella antarctica TaxID=1902245 RepID=A0A3G8ZJB9_9ACTN|nr:Gfo/Idh/MocA family oxidoreductase [Nakamurella antarctica]AZI56857.1 gfo/Idh/MocA family oxidoreductase [Nakamurella antarctica]